VRWANTLYRADKRWDVHWPTRLKTPPQVKFWTVARERHARRCGRTRIFAQHPVRFPRFAKRRRARLAARGAAWRLRFVTLLVLFFALPAFALDFPHSPGAWWMTPTSSIPQHARR